jgi:site-specific DNA-methyltransferase (adenine-specific)
MAGQGMRNRTIQLSEIDIESYSNRCLRGDSAFTIADLQNKVIIGNSFETFPLLPDNFVDLLIVDPPYNLYKSYGKTNFKKMSEAQYIEFTEKWIEGLLHTLKNSTSIYVCCDWNSSTLIAAVLKRYFTIQNRITWQREKGRGALRNWKNSMEDIWFCTVSKDFTFNVDDVKMRRRVIAPYKVDGKPKDWFESKQGNFRDTYPSNFWDDISVPYWSMSENTPHPTQKPEKLIAKLILANSNKGDFVFDPFLGSGTSAVVAKKLERNFLGIELESEYCAYTQKRLELADENKSIQGYTDGVFWERNTANIQKPKKVIQK